MIIAKLILKILDTLLTLAVALSLTLAGGYSAYALWDNDQVYTAAEDVQLQMLSLKPETDTDEEQGPSFEELLAINPDVCGWLELEETGIDYPVLQGSDNMTYINTDVYGNFALAGSIFLDSGCDNTFSEAYSLIHGHHMENSKMFGDLDLYKDQAFFDKNTRGTLILPGHRYELEIFACLVVPSSEKKIFEPQRWQADIDGLLAFTAENALHIHQNVIDDVLLTSDNPQVMALATCSSEYTNARTIILAAMIPYSPSM